MKTESSHLQTCLAAAVAPSDAEPGHKCSLSSTCAFGKIRFSSLKMKAVKQLEATPPFRNDGIRIAEGAARLTALKSTSAVQVSTGVSDQYRNTH